MIHISIPSTQTLVEADGRRKYDAFDLHVNGAYHASIRYSQLLKIHEKLREHFGPKLKVPDFPSRKLFKTLDKKTLNERRLALARYFQAVIQQQPIAHHFIMENAFLNFQVESFRPSSSNVSIDIFIADGSKETVLCNVDHPTDIVLKRFADLIGMSVENVGNFGLFVAKRRYTSGDRQYNCNIDYPDVLSVRLLRNFESPYLSIHLLNQKSAALGVFYFVMIRKLVWDPRIEEEMLDDPGSVLLLYKQAVSDMHNDHFVPKTDIRQRLLALEERGNCVQFLRLCHTQPNYSYEVLEPCMSDYPQPNTRCNLKVGRRHILLEYEDSETKNIMHAQFRATRIRVWRIALQETREFSFQFEYLMSKDTFSWITLMTNQAILLSLLLQSVGYEILKEHKSLMYSSCDYDYPTKGVFNISGQPVSSSPVLVVKNPAAPIPEPVVKIMNEGSKKNGSDVSGSDPLTTASSQNGSTHSLTASGSSKEPQVLNATTVMEPQEYKDLFTIISKALPPNNEASKITDDDL